jgi:alpha-mannosidase
MSLRKEEEISLSTWGVGNHGGGPSDKDLSDIEALQKTSPIPVIHSTPEAFFAEVDPQEKFAGSLISCMVGCYTSMVGMKQAYRELERQLLFSEKIASVAYLDGKMEYPMERFESAVEDMLNVEFHDILPGTMIQAGERNGMTFVQHGLHDLNQIRAKAFFALIQGEKPAEANTYPIFVFNPKANEAEQLVECDLSILRDDVSAPWATRLIIQDEAGHVLPSQNIKESSNLALNWRKKVVFLAPLKPLGITRFTASAAPNQAPDYPLDQDIVFENADKKVIISAKTGLIESYKLQGKEMANGSLFQPLAYQDYADPWGMNYDHVGEKPHPFRFLSKPDGVFAGLHGLEVIEDGDVYLGAEAFFGDGLTRLRIGYKIYKKGPRIDVDVTLFPGEINQAYKLALPLKGNHYGGEQVFGYEELYQDGRECVAHDYVALQEGEGRYLEILTPDSYGSSYQKGEIALTLLRTATYCAHPISKERPLLRSNIFIEKIDQGEHHFRFALAPAQEGELKEKADLFAERPFALNVFPTIDEARGKEIPLVLSNPEINLVAFKKGLERTGMILRLQNCSSAKKTCQVRVGESEKEFTFAPYEVKTLLYTSARLEECGEMII